MKLEVQVKINELQTIKATFEEDKVSQALLQANALLSYKGFCGCCGSKNLTLQTKMAKEYQFVEFVCSDCNAKAQWGAYKKGGCFLKSWEKYQGQGSTKPVPEVDVDQPPLEDNPPF